MNIAQISQSLWDTGVRGVKIHWSAGGDDGSVSEFELLPSDRKIDYELQNTLEALAWHCYENDFNGGTAGEFSCYGNLDILILENGKYKASAVNTYEEEEYNSETAEYEESSSDTTTIAKVVLS